MLGISADLKGKDTVFISNTYRYHSGLCGLSIYRNPPAGLSTAEVKVELDALQQAYEGGATGNHAQVALRRVLRKKVTETFKKIILYLRMVATENDIPALIQAGFVVRQRVPRKKAVVAPA
ncbi:hypothetical protein [Geomesophilobacter sediminis]|uniref:Uncharacterized protein n=1 Tax=Geomesophilobacter sediminis TaxID=2798584 RepID=A0A8J7M0V2_9BACT|nr:hypothetical protein [Geomesophilobacter sediminis]MBJ6726544.1 hypothetical protein [Geomesophilobacter sediminis]